MTLQVSEGTWWCECDLCGHCDEFGEYEATFREAVEAVKSSGWKVHRLHGDWEHICPSCLEDIENGCV